MGKDVCNVCYQGAVFVPLCLAAKNHIFLDRNMDILYKFL